MRSWEIPDETPARCDCGAGTYDPTGDGWEHATDGWWCLDCLLEVTAA